MLQEARDWWETHGREYQEEWCHIPIDILYGPGSPNEDELQLIGPVARKRVLEIGCGGAQAAIAFAKRGALVTGVDIAASELEVARRLIAGHGVVVKLIQSDMADLSAIASASQDVVFSACAFGYVDDLLTCFREVQRVLVPEGLFVWGMGHPFVYAVQSTAMESTAVDCAAPRLSRSYFERGPHIDGYETGSPFASVHRTVSDYFNLLVEAGFVVDKMLEPDSRRRYACDPWYGLWDYTPEVLAQMPGTLIIKSHKPHVAG